MTTAPIAVRNRPIIGDMPDPASDLELGPYKLRNCVFVFDPSSCRMAPMKRDSRPSLRKISRISRTMNRRFLELHVNEIVIAIPFIARRRNRLQLQYFVQLAHTVRVIFQFDHRSADYGQAGALPNENSCNCTQDEAAI